MTEISLITTEIPRWKYRRMHEMPENGAPLLWSGRYPVPEIGDPVYVHMNQIGPGVVTGYLSQGGYLGCLVQVDEHTRPDWHKRQSPDNRPCALFGAEMTPGGEALKAIVELFNTHRPNRPLTSTDVFKAPFFGFGAGTSIIEIDEWLRRQQERHASNKAATAALGAA